MQRPSYSVLVIALLVLLFVVPAAQGGELRLAPYTVNSLFLNQQIISDTLASGARRDSNCVYILTRGGLYLSNGVITNSGYPLTIVANDSNTTARPVVFLAPNPSTGLPPGQFVMIRGDLVIRDIILSGYDERTASNLAGLQGAFFNTGVAGKNITLDNCIFVNTNGNHVRTDQAARNIKITNCIFGNMGYLGTSNLGAGKALDLRAGSVDTAYIVNNTFVNWQDRIIRHYSSTANIGYLRFDHNTLVNGMSYHGLLSLGRVGYRIEVTNNLFFDAFALGNDSDAVRQAEFGDSGEKDAWGGNRMVWVISVPNDSTSWNIRNNYYTVSDSGQAFYDDAGADPALWEGSPLTWATSTKLGADSVTAFQKEGVTLNKVPNLMTNFMRWYRLPAALGGAGKTKVVTNWAAAYDYDRRSYRYFRDTLDCAYGTSSPLYTAGAGGYPVGDLNWYPAQKTLWLDDPISTGVAEQSPVPKTYALDQNFPNPFNPATKISFSLPKAGYTTLTIYNLLGQRVATLVEGEMAAGQHVATFDASKISSGVYFYRLESGKFSDVKKMILLR